MKRSISLLRYLVIGCILITGNLLFGIDSDSLRWINAVQLQSEGQGWTDIAHPFDRLPAKSRLVVRQKVWELSQHSSGIVVYFATNSPEIKVRWQNRIQNHMPHMTDIGTAGLDLYAFDPVQNQWRFINAAKTWDQNTLKEASLGEKIAPGFIQYQLYLPLYDGIDSLAIGIHDTAGFESFKPQHRISKPIVFYGTSITQGGCATRPGMSYPAIIGRKMDVEAINLGFSGNGKMDFVLAELLAELDPAAYIIDCLPNMTPQMVLDSAAVFLRYLHSQRPQTPLILVASADYAYSWIRPETALLIEEKNRNLKQVYAQLVQEFPKQIFLLGPEQLAEADNEGTVDGVHLTDLGFQRFAGHLVPLLKQVLNP
jgi:hypothetical protein